MNTHTTIQKAFYKYDADRKQYLTKLEFKCAFIYLTGMKPSKQDMQVIREYVTSCSQSQQDNDGGIFRVESQEFDKVMGLYINQIESDQTGKATGQKEEGSID